MTVSFNFLNFLNCFFFFFVITMDSFYNKKTINLFLKAGN